MKVFLTSAPVFFVSLVCFAPGIHVLADEATVYDGRWSESIQESSSDAFEYSVPTGTVMTGREHTGDENGDTRYHYSRIQFQGQAVVPNDDSFEWSGILEQENLDFSCTANKVVTGRSHEGDETGPTKIQCASLVSTDLPENEWSGTIEVGSAQWSDRIQESSGVAFMCPPDQVLIGMQHEGDEQGNTRYSCAPIVITRVQDCAITGQAVGRWESLLFSNGGLEQKYRVGITRSTEFQNSKTKDWEASVTASVSAGFSFANAGLQVTAGFAESVTSSVTEAVSLTEEKTTTFTFPGGGVMWQFVFNFSDKCDSDWQLRTGSLVTTENQVEFPCCLPGLARNNEEQHGPCLNASPCACDEETCSALQPQQPSPQAPTQDEPSPQAPTQDEPSSQAFSRAKVTLALAFPAIFGYLD